MRADVVTICGAFHVQCRFRPSPTTRNRPGSPPGFETRRRTAIHDACTGAAGTGAHTVEARSNRARADRHGSAGIRRVGQRCGRTPPANCGRSRRGDTHRGGSRSAAGSSRAPDRRASACGARAAGDARAPSGGRSAGGRRSAAVHRHCGTPAGDLGAAAAPCAAPPQSGRIRPAVKHKGTTGTKHTKRKRARTQRF